jgi:hypothetical protein
MHPVAKLDHETDPPDSNSHRADCDAKIGCRVDRTGDNPDDASEDDAERNEMAGDCVAHLLRPRVAKKKGPLAIARGPREDKAAKNDAPFGGQIALGTACRNRGLG